MNKFSIKFVFFLLGVFSCWRVCKAQANYNQRVIVDSWMDSSSCFSSKASVQLNDLTYVKVSDLKPGDYIRTYDHSRKQIVSSRFIDYLQYDKSTIFKFISIKTADDSMPSLEISEYHLIQILNRDSMDNEHEFVF